MIKTEFTREKIVQFLLGLGEEIVFTSHPLDLVLLDLRLPGTQLSSEGRKLDLEIFDDKTDLLEGDNQLLVFGEGLLALKGHTILLEAADVVRKTGIISLEGDIQLRDFDQLGLQLSHRLSHLDLIRIPLFQHIFNGVGHFLALGTRSFGFFLGLGPVIKGSGQSFIDR